MFSYMCLYISLSDRTYIYVKVSIIHCMDVCEYISYNLITE